MWGRVRSTREARAFVGTRKARALVTSATRVGPKDIFAHVAIYNRQPLGGTLEARALVGTREERAFGGARRACVWWREKSVRLVARAKRVRKCGVISFKNTDPSNFSILLFCNDAYCLMVFVVDDDDDDDEALHFPGC